VCWRGAAASAAQARAAIASARAQAPAWAQTPIDQRLAALDAFAAQLEAHRAELAQIISAETGKPAWEASAEVGAMINKVPITVEAMRARRPMETSSVLGEAGEATRYKPLGVLVVLGPFNLPGHLPNGHIVPALLAGNTVVFKPSEHTPWTGAYVASLWAAAGLPAGVLNVVQGACEVGASLVHVPLHDGVLFTGSVNAGLALRRALVEQPQRILALEMGGNNPLVVHEASDARAAAILAAQSAFLTAGQRCTCARRLIVPHGAAGDALVDALIDRTRRLRLGPPAAEPAPFMGPMVDDAAAEAIMQTAASLQAKGGQTLLAPTQPGPTAAFVTPGIIDVSAIDEREDAEVFGPLLQVIRVADFDAAIDEANNTAFGLVAGLLSDRHALYARFHQQVRAGLINWNKPTTGASSRLPFGGVGKSGNFRPSGAFAIDYCTYPVASLESDALTMPATLPTGMELGGK
jgi:succinylglutamic semialdehyde dehydrogenase